MMDRSSPKRIVNQQFYSCRRFAALSRAAAKMHASFIAELEWVVVSKAFDRLCQLNG
jgi:hypothetical protein